MSFCCMAFLLHGYKGLLNYVVISAERNIDLANVAFNFIILEYKHQIFAAGYRDVGTGQTYS